MTGKFYYFGQDAKGFYADDEAQRHYMDRERWLQFIHAANIPEPTHRVKLSIKESISVEVYEGQDHIRTVHLNPDTTEI